MQARICVQRSKSPVLVSPNSAIPTLLNINKGPELLVKQSNLSPSSLETNPFSLNSETILAPTG